MKNDTAMRSLKDTTDEALSALTRQDLAAILFGGLDTGARPSQLAVVLGGPVRTIPERADAAADLFARGLTEWIMPSGGVERDADGRRMTEAEMLRERLLEHGVPDDRILLENRARTTHENMTWSLCEIVRKFGYTGIRDICIVSSPCHLRRSCAIAAYFFPHDYRISCYGGVSDSSGAFLQNADGEDTARYEVFYLREIIRNGMCGDMYY